MRVRIGHLVVLLLLCRSSGLAERFVVTPQEFAELATPGQEFHLVMKTGHTGSGRIHSTSETAVTVKVKKSQDHAVLAIGLQAVPYRRIASVSLTTRKGNKRTKLPLILCLTVGTVALVAAASTEEKKSTYLPRAAGLTVGLGIGGYYLGKKLDGQIVTYVINEE